MKQLTEFCELMADDVADHPGPRNAELARGLRWLASHLPEMMRDKARMDWLDEVRDSGVEISTTHLDILACVMWRDDLRPKRHTGPQLREAIDAARLTQGERPNE